MDYVSHIEVVEGERKIEGRVSMNNILSHRHYRLYQSGHDEDGDGATLSVSISSSAACTPTHSRMEQI
ncbi:MAG: hypothetical protein IKA70_00010 [Alistipes sp.]|nr:hypothetical protein [Alistipes sp.]